MLHEVSISFEFLRKDEGAKITNISDLNVLKFLKMNFWISNLALF